MTWDDVRRMVDGFELAGWEASGRRGWSGTADHQEWTIEMTRGENAPNLHSPPATLEEPPPRVRHIAGVAPVVLLDEDGEPAGLGVPL